MFLLPGSRVRGRFNFRCVPSSTSSRRAPALIQSRSSYAPSKAGYDSQALQQSLWSSVARRWPSVTIDLVVAVMKGVAIVLGQGRRYGRITEARMAVWIGRRSFGNVTLRCFYAVMMTLFGSLRIGRRRRRIVRRRLGMGTAGKCKRNQQSCERKNLLHDVASFF